MKAVRKQCEAEPAWSGLFPEGDFEWTLRMRLEDPAAFFNDSDQRGNLLKEKAALLAGHPDRHLAEVHEASTILPDLIKHFDEWGLDLSENVDDFDSLSRRIEPDFLIMEPDSQRLLVASVCFPSSWDPARWIGQPLTAIHEVVPRLNPQIGPMIDRFLKQLKTGKAYRRANWSLTHGDALNFHPALERPPIDADTPIDEVYLRLEHQIFAAIPGAVLMGIRIEPVPLASLREYPELWQHLLQKLATMPEDVARYKNLHRGLESVVSQMRALAQ